MHGSKFALLKSDAFFIDNLSVSYQISIVSFSIHAQRILPLCKLIEHEGENAKRCMNSLSASGSTNIVEPLEKGVRVLEERVHQDSVSGIIFFSDGRDICYRCTIHVPHPGHRPQYLHLLTVSIYPPNRGMEDHGQQQTFLVTFWFGVDHGLLSMFAISVASNGVFSFESYENVEDGFFPSCYGAPLCLVAQSLELILSFASNGTQIRSICSRYSSEISDERSLVSQST